MLRQLSHRRSNKNSTTKNSTTAVVYTSFAEVSPPQSDNPQRSESGSILPEINFVEPSDSIRDKSGKTIIQLADEVIAALKKAGFPNRVATSSAKGFIDEYTCQYDLIGALEFKYGKEENFNVRIEPVKEAYKAFTTLRDSKKYNEARAREMETEKEGTMDTSEMLEFLRQRRAEQAKQKVAARSIQETSPNAQESKALKI